jgi:hypothetical protein
LVSKDRRHLFVTHWKQLMTDLHEASRMKTVCRVVCMRVARDARKAIRCSSN